MAYLTFDFHNMWENFDFSGKHSATNVPPRIYMPILVFCVIMQSYLESFYQNFGGSFCLTLYFWYDDGRGRSLPYVIQSKLFTSSQPRGPLFEFFTAIKTWDCMRNFFSSRYLYDCVIHVLSSSGTTNLRWNWCR